MGAAVHAGVGGWSGLGAEPVVTPAALALDGGVWHHLKEGVRGVVARDERELPVVYALVEPATHYYRVMRQPPASKLTGVLEADEAPGPGGTISAAC